MKDTAKGSAAIAAVLCRVIDYYVAKQAQEKLISQGDDAIIEEIAKSVSRCGRAEQKIADAVANIAVEVMK